MAFLEKIVLYLIIALGIVIFLKLDRRMSILTRLMIAIVAVLIMVLLLFFISAIVVILIVVLLAILIISFLERKGFRFRK